MPIFSSLPADSGQERGRAADLKEFAETLYGRGLVSQACVTLQDESGADVNLLLFAVWAASVGLVLSKADAARAIELCSQWREHIVLPARALRRNIKRLADVAESEELYRQSKRIELTAEFAQLSLLSSLTLQRGDEPFSVLVRHNVTAYSDNLQKPLASEGVEVVVTEARQLVAEQSAPH